MDKIKSFLAGKKSYVTIALGIIAGILQSQGIPVPDWVYPVLAGVLGITYKAGQNRTEQLTKDLLDEVKKTKNGSNQ